jgi:hypothetical protein
MISLGELVAAVRRAMLRLAARVGVSHRAFGVLFLGGINFTYTSYSFAREFARSMAGHGT